MLVIEIYKFYMCSAFLVKWPLSAISQKYEIFSSFSSYSTIESMEHNVAPEPFFILLLFMLFYISY